MGGVAMKFLADRFTGGDTGEVEDFLLAAKPEELADLKQADLEFKAHMAELVYDDDLVLLDGRPVQPSGEHFHAILYRQSGNAFLEITGMMVLAVLLSVCSEAMPSRLPSRSPVLGVSPSESRP